MTEYDPHPVFGIGVPSRATPELVAQFEGLMAPLTVDYRKGSVASYESIGT